MTPEMFQDALCEEIRGILKDRRYKKPPKEPEVDSEDIQAYLEGLEEGQTEIVIPPPVAELVKMTVYPQNIPVPLSEEEEENPVPYIIVRLNGGKDANVSDSEYIMEVVVIMGIWDDDRKAQGHRELLNIINLVYARFMKNPCLDNQYVYKGGFEWDIQEDGYYPYYFGAFKMNFAIPAIRREDPFC